jgi:hypothetical protein
MSHALPPEEPRAPGSWVLGACAALIVVASVADIAAHGLTQLGFAGIFFASIAVGDVLRVSLPGDREIAPVGTAIALAYVLLTQVGSQQVTHGAYQSTVVVACGLLIGTLPRLVAGRPPRMDYLTSRVVAASLSGFVFRASYLGITGQGPIPHHSQNAYIVMLIAAALLFGVTEVVLGAMQWVIREQQPMMAALRNEFAAQLGVSAAVLPTGLLIALACQTMGLLAIPIVSVPLLVAQFAFRRFATIRSTYQQTIQALSRVTEISGYTMPGHARRVSRLALAIGRDLGMTEHELLELRYASLMHDIGQLSLTEPIPGGATLMVARETAELIATRGADVIQQSGALDGVAELVRHQTDHYQATHEVRRPIEEGRGSRASKASKASKAADTSTKVDIDAGAGQLVETTQEQIPLGSRIIRVANAFDDLVGDSLEPDRQLNALEELRLATVVDYDPAVVRSLGRVINRSLRHLL